MSTKRIILWFRQDLRLHDNEALTDALKQSKVVIPLYVFDERLFKGTSSFGFPRIGYNRTKFIIESVQDLRHNLQKAGSDLYVRSGKPEEIIFQWCQQLNVQYVYCNRERTHEEVRVQDDLERKLWTLGKELKYFRGKMLLHTMDLPFPVAHCPDQFNQFKKEIDRIVPIRPPLPAPEFISPTQLRHIGRGQIPDLQAYFPNGNGRVDAFIKGGETHALGKLSAYFKSLQTKDYTLKAGNLFNSKLPTSQFAAYLAQGCISPKLIYQELKKLEQIHGESTICHQLFLNLLYRDFLRFVAKKYGNKIFEYRGIHHAKIQQPLNNLDLFKRWSEGITGIPIIDANMIQMNATGYMSKLGRQLCASFLVHELGLNWKMGAEYFESKLIDYDPCSNWGNWNRIAGVGSEQKVEKYKNPVFQAKKHDPTGQYVRYWIPELSKIPEKYVHEPYKWEQETV